MQLSNPDALGTSFFAIIAVVYLLLAGISIYCLVLFIKLARRGITALEIYIENNKRN